MNPLPSIRRIAAIASITFTELIRLKLFYAVCAIGLLLIGGSVFFARFSFQEEFQILKDISLGTITIFSALLAIIATANLIPRDVEDRTAYAILAKAVPRKDYVIGKLLGAIGLIALSVLLMSALFFAILALRENAVLNALQQSPASSPQDMAATIATIHHAASWQLVAPATLMIFLRSAVIAALTLFVSTFATSNAFTIVVMMLVYFVAQLEPIAREYWLQARTAGVAARSFLALVAIAFPDLQALDFGDAVASGIVLAAPLILKAVALALFYVVLYTLLSIASFSGREL